MKKYLTKFHSIETYTNWYKPFVIKLMMY